MNAMLPEAACLNKHRLALPLTYSCVTMVVEYSFSEQLEASLVPYRAFLRCPQLFGKFISAGSSTCSSFLITSACKYAYEMSMNIILCASFSCI